MVLEVGGPGLSRGVGDMRPAVIADHSSQPVFRLGVWNALERIKEVKAVHLAHISNGRPNTKILVATASGTDRSSKSVSSKGSLIQSSTS